MFDLSPANLVGKYPGKTGLIMLIHLIQKVSRLLQPTILYFEDAEKPFMKKIPKTDKTDPKRLKKDLQKIVKNIAPEDRVMLIGVSNAPWVSLRKYFLKFMMNFIIFLRMPIRNCFNKPIIGLFTFHVLIMELCHMHGVNYLRKLTLNLYFTWN